MIYIEGDRLLIDFRVTSKCGSRNQFSEDFALPDDGRASFASGIWFVSFAPHRRL